MTFANQSRSATSGIRAARLAAVSGGGAAASIASESPTPAARAKAKPVDKATAQKRRRLIIAGLVLMLTYISVMEPKKVEVMTQKFGMLTVGLGLTTPSAVNLGTIAGGPSTGMLAAAASGGKIETGASASGAGAGGSVGAAVRLGIESFWVKQRAPATGESDFAVKAELSLANGPVETIWVRSVTRDGNKITGSLASTPVALKGLREGSKVAFDVSRVAGWRFNANGAMIAGDVRK